MLKKILTTLLVALQLGTAFVPAAMAHPAKTNAFRTVEVLSSKVEAGSTQLAQTTHDHNGFVQTNSVNEHMPCHDSKPAQKHCHHCDDCSGCQSCPCAAPVSAIGTAFSFQKPLTAQASLADLIAQLPQHITSAIYHPPKH
jgi:hypothetical protein